MTRDDDYIRELLLEVAASDGPYLIALEVLAPSPEELKRHTHAMWLCDDGHLAMVRKEGIFRLTNRGNDYLAAIRDEGIRKQTKDIAATAGGATLAMMKDIAIAALKEKVKEVARRYGLPL